MEEKTKNTYNQLVDICKKHSIDAATLLEMNDQSRDIVLNSQIGSEKEREKISELLDNWNNYRLLHQNNIDYEKRKEFLESDSKTMKIYLTKLYNSNYPKFVFLPEKAYSGSASTVQGIVVDLQDIHQISMDYIQPLQTFEYDFQMITDTEQVEKINRLFFFENKDDFVMASDVVKSPWIEYLLQNFSFSFIRIGVENATEDEIKSFCNEW